MIVTHLKHSYPNLIDDVRAGSTHVMPSMQLEGFTRGVWPPMSSSTATGYLDYLVGTWRDVIVSAYGVNAIVPTAEGKVRFEYQGDDDDRKGLDGAIEAMFNSNVRIDPAEWLIGCPIPGGPWKQGESRNTRRYNLEAYLGDYPSLVSRIGEDFGGRMALHLLEHFAGTRQADLEEFPALAEAGGAVVPSGTDVTVVRQPGGAVVVTIPTGTRAQILIEP